MFQRSRRHIILGFIAFIAITASQFVHGQVFEPYSIRPHISQVQAKTHSLKWSDTRGAHFNFGALLLEIYQVWDIYFIARDAEFFHDATYLIASDSERSRLHLLNVSRANQDAEGIEDYLAQEGISSSKLESGKKILLVDTGYNGNIPKNILSRLSDKAQANARIHLILSFSNQYASARTFLIGLRNKINELELRTLHEPMLQYETYPRYTSRASKFEKINGVIQAMSDTRYHTFQGKTDKPKTVEYMEDLKAFKEQPQTEVHVDSVRKLTALIALALTSLDKPKSERISLLKNLIDNSTLNEAILRDCIDALSKIQADSLDISVIDLGLREQLAEPATPKNCDGLLEPAS